MIVKLLTEHHLEFLRLKGGCRGLSESTLVKKSNCWNEYQQIMNWMKCCFFFVASQSVLFNSSNDLIQTFSSGFTEIRALLRIPLNLRY